LLPIQFRNALESVASEIEGKTFEEVSAYAEVFWERYRELPSKLSPIKAYSILFVRYAKPFAFHKDYEEIIAKIDRGEARLRQTMEIQMLLEAKVAKYRSPLSQMQIQYNQAKGKNYTEAEDRFLLVMLTKYGYGTEDVYERIREEIEAEGSLFKFNWFIRSRTTAEIARRCSTLISLLQKEQTEIEEKEREERRARIDNKVCCVVMVSAIADY